MVSVDCMLFIILSVSVKAVKMFCAEALAPRAWKLKPEDLLSPLRLMCNLRNPNLSLYPVLTFHHLLQGLSRLCLDQFAITCPLRLKPSLAHP